MAEYIDREKLIAEYDRVHVGAAGGARKLMVDAPAADVAPVVHARWEEWDDVCGCVYYHCSACGENWSTIDGTPAENNMHYCPCCGAKMDKAADCVADACPLTGCNFGEADAV